MVWGAARHRVGVHLTTRAWEEVDIEGITSETLALALYIVKYEDLPNSEEPDECKFPLYFIYDELCSIKEGTFSGEAGDESPETPKRGNQM